MVGLSRRTLFLLKEAFKELLSSKLNLFFMSFGLIVGIAAMTSIYSLGRGTEATIVKILKSLNFGSNSFLILAGGGKFFGPATTRRDTFTLEDVEVIKRLEFVKDVSPVQFKMLPVSSLSKTRVIRVLGVLPVYRTVNNWDVVEGRFITLDDLKRKSKICVIGYDTAKKLFGNNALGKKLRINGIYFEVVGVLEKKGIIGRFRLDDRVLLPLTTTQYRVFNRRWIDAAKVLMFEGTDMKKAREVVANILRKRHHIGPTEVDDFRIITPDQIVEFLTRATKALTVMLLIISLITLVVSGIIIMNIMYAVVEEKSKIIALRMAVGASAKDIVIHYLSIVGVVSLIGGVFGYLAGLFIVFVISAISPVSGVYSISFLFPALVFALVTGLIFGVAPARKAASIPPAELLR